MTFFLKHKRMDKIYDYDTFDFHVDKGTKGDVLDTSVIVKGKIIAMALFLDNEVPASTINLTLKYNDGSRVFKGTTIKDWIPRNAGYLQSMKPVSIEGGQKFLIEFSSKVTLLNDFSGQLLFVLEKEPCNQRL